MAKGKGFDLVTSSGERFSYILYYGGIIIYYMIVTSFLQLYLTNIGIPAAIIGTIFLITRIWDAVNDPIFGVIVDKVNLKKGKYLPWIRISTFLIPLTTILIFSIPADFSLQVKILMAVGSYMLWDTAYTLADAPIYSLATAMTSHIDERNRLYINAMITTFIGGLLATVAVPLMFPAIGWPATVAILSVLGISSMLPVGFKAKERFVVKDQNPSFGDLMRYVVRNKYLLIYHGALIIVSLAGTASPVQAFFAIHHLGGTEYISIIALISTIPMVVAVFVVKALINKFDKVYLAVACLLGGGLTGVLMYFVGYGNLMVLYALIALRAVFGATNIVLIAMFTADCAEYGNFVTGDRAMGVTFAIRAFTAKITAAISSAVCMFLLGIFGFVEGENVVQSETAVAAIWSLFTWVPIVSGAVAAALLAVGYKLRQKDVAFMVSVNKGEMTREEAVAQMSRKY